MSTSDYDQQYVVNYFKENDLVWVPFLKKGQPDTPGKILETKWKTNGQWCKVEVTFIDMAGQKHTTIIPKIHSSKLTKREEE